MVFARFIQKYGQMKRFLLILAALAAFVSCGTSRRLSTDTKQVSWVGHTAIEIMRVLGNPDSIDDDGRGGSILRYNMEPNYEDPAYDIMAPEAVPSNGGYAYFFLDRYGDCYSVDTNRELPAPAGRSEEWLGLWVDVLIFLPLVVIGLLFP